MKPGFLLPKNVDFFPLIACTVLFGRHIYLRVYSKCCSQPDIEKHKTLSKKQSTDAFYVFFRRVKEYLSAYTFMHMKLTGPQSIQIEELNIHLGMVFYLRFYLLNVHCTYFLNFEIIEQYHVHVSFNAKTALFVSWLHLCIKRHAAIPVNIQHHSVSSEHLPYAQYVLLCRFLNVYHLLIKFTSHSVECSFRGAIDWKKRVCCALCTMLSVHTLTALLHWNWIVQIIYANPDAPLCIHILNNREWWMPLKGGSVFKLLTVFIHGMFSNVIFFFCLFHSSSFPFCPSSVERYQFKLSFLL